MACRVGVGGLSGWRWWLLRKKGQETPRGPEMVFKNKRDSVQVNDQTAQAHR